MRVCGKSRFYCFKARKWFSVFSRHRTLLFLLSAVIGPIMCSAVAFAQCCTGALTGVVTAPDGSKLAGVRVQLSRLATRSPHSEAATDNKGQFQFAGLTPGTYTL